MDINLLKSKEQNIIDLLKKEFETEIRSDIGLSSYLIFRDGTLVGAFRHRDMMDFLHKEGVLTDEEVDAYDTTIFNEVFDCVRCTDYRDSENYIGLPGPRLTNAQYATLTDWIDNNIEIGRKDIQVTANFRQDNQKSVLYNYKSIIDMGSWPSKYIINKIKKYYASGKLEEDVKPEPIAPYIHNIGDKIVALPPEASVEVIEAIRERENEDSDLLCLINNYPSGDITGVDGSIVWLYGEPESLFNHNLADHRDWNKPTLTYIIPGTSKISSSYAAPSYVLDIINKYPREKNTITEDIDSMSKDNLTMYHVSDFGDNFGSLKPDMYIIPISLKEIIAPMLADVVDEDDDDDSGFNSNYLLYECRWRYFGEDSEIIPGQLTMTDVNTKRIQRTIYLTGHDDIVDLIVNYPNKKELTDPHDIRAIHDDVELVEMLINGQVFEQLRTDNVSKLKDKLLSKKVDVRGFWNICSVSQHMDDLSDEEREKFQDALKEFDNIKTKIPVIGYYKGEKDPGSYLVWGITKAKALKLALALRQEDVIFTQILGRHNVLKVVRYKNAQNHNFKSFDAQKEYGNLVMIDTKPDDTFRDRGCTGWENDDFYYSFNLYKEYASPEELRDFNELALNEDIDSAEAPQLDYAHNYLYKGHYGPASPYETAEELIYNEAKSPYFFVCCYERERYRYKLAGRVYGPTDFADAYDFFINMDSEGRSRDAYITIDFFDVNASDMIYTVMQKFLNESLGEDISSTEMEETFPPNELVTGPTIHIGDEKYTLSTNGYPRIIDGKKYTSQELIDEFRDSSVWTIAVHNSINIGMGAIIKSFVDFESALECYNSPRDELSISPRYKYISINFDKGFVITPVLVRQLDDVVNEDVKSMPVEQVDYDKRFLFAPGAVPSPKVSAELIDKFGDLDYWYISKGIYSEDLPRGYLSWTPEDESNEEINYISFKEAYDIFKNYKFAENEGAIDIVFAPSGEDCFVELDTWPGHIVDDCSFNSVMSKKFDGKPWVKYNPVHEDINPSEEDFNWKDYLVIDEELLDTILKYTEGKDWWSIDIMGDPREDNYVWQEGSLGEIDTSVYGDLNGRFTWDEALTRFANATVPDDQKIYVRYKPPFYYDEVRAKYPDIEVDTMHDITSEWTVLIAEGSHPVLDEDITPIEAEPVPPKDEKPVSWEQYLKIKDYFGPKGLQSIYKVWFDKFIKYEDKFKNPKETGYTLTVHTKNDGISNNKHTRLSLYKLNLRGNRHIEWTWIPAQLAKELALREDISTEEQDISTLFWSPITAKEMIASLDDDSADAPVRVACALFEDGTLVRLTDDFAHAFCMYTSQTELENELLPRLNISPLDYNDFSKTMERHWVLFLEQKGNTYYVYFPVDISDAQFDFFTNNMDILKDKCFCYNMNSGKDTSVAEIIPTYRKLREDIESTESTAPMRTIQYKVEPEFSVCKFAVDFDTIPAIAALHKEIYGFDDRNLIWVTQANNTAVTPREGGKVFITVPIYIEGKSGLSDDISVSYDIEWLLNGSRDSYPLVDVDQRGFVIHFVENKDIAKANLDFLYAKGIQNILGLPDILTDVWNKYEEYKNDVTEKLSEDISNQEYDLTLDFDRKYLYNYKGDDSEDNTIWSEDVKRIQQHGKNRVWYLRVGDILLNWSYDGSNNSFPVPEYAAYNGLKTFEEAYELFQAFDMHKFMDDMATTTHITLQICDFTGKNDNGYYPVLFRKLTSEIAMEMNEDITPIQVMNRYSFDKHYLNATSDNRYQFEQDIKTIQEKGETAEWFFEFNNFSTRVEYRGFDTQPEHPHERFPAPYEKYNGKMTFEEAYPLFDNFDFKEFCDSQGIASDEEEEDTGITSEQSWGLTLVYAPIPRDILFKCGHDEELIDVNNELYEDIDSVPANYIDSFNKAYLNSLYDPGRSNDIALIEREGNNPVWYFHFKNRNTGLECGGLSGLEFSDARYKYSEHKFPDAYKEYNGKMTFEQAYPLFEKFNFEEFCKSQGLSSTITSSTGFEYPQTWALSLVCSLTRDTVLYKHDGKSYIYMGEDITSSTVPNVLDYSRKFINSRTTTGRAQAQKLIAEHGKEEKWYIRIHISKSTGFPKYSLYYYGYRDSDRDDMGEYKGYMTFEDAYTKFISFDPIDFILDRAGEYTGEETWDILIGLKLDTGKDIEGILYRSHRSNGSDGDDRLDEDITSEVSDDGTIYYDRKYLNNRLGTQLRNRDKKLIQQFGKNRVWTVHVALECGIVMGTSMIATERFPDCYTNYNGMKTFEEAYELFEKFNYEDFCDKVNAENSFHFNPDYEYWGIGIDYQPLGETVLYDCPNASYRSLSSDEINNLNLLDEDIQPVEYKGMSYDRRYLNTFPDSVREREADVQLIDEEGKNRVWTLIVNTNTDYGRIVYGGNFVNSSTDSTVYDIFPDCCNEYNGLKTFEEAYRLFEDFDFAKFRDVINKAKGYNYINGKTWGITIRYIEDCRDVLYKSSWGSAVDTGRFTLAQIDGTEEIKEDISHSEAFVPDYKNRPDITAVSTVNPYEVMNAHSDEDVWMLCFTGTGKANWIKDYNGWEGELGEEYVGPFTLKEAYDKFINWTLADSPDSVPKDKSGVLHLDIKTKIRGMYGIFDILDRRIEPDVMNEDVQSQQGSDLGIKCDWCRNGNYTNYRYAFYNLTGESKNILVDILQTYLDASSDSNWWLKQMTGMIALDSTIGVNVDIEASRSNNNYYRITIYIPNTDEDADNSVTLTTERNNELVNRMLQQIVDLVDFNNTPETVWEELTEDIEVQSAYDDTDIKRPEGQSSVSNLTSASYILRGKVKDYVLDIVYQFAMEDDGDRYTRLKEDVTRLKTCDDIIIRCIGDRGGIIAKISTPEDDHYPIVLVRLYSASNTLEFQVIQEIMDICGFNPRLGLTDIDPMTIEESSELDEDIEPTEQDYKFVTMKKDTEYKSEDPDRLTQLIYIYDDDVLALIDILERYASNLPRLNDYLESLSQQTKVIIGITSFKYYISFVDIDWTGGTLVLGSNDNINCINAIKRMCEFKDWDVMEDEPFDD